MPNLPPQWERGTTSRQAHVGLPPGTVEEEHGRDGFYGPAGTVHCNLADYGKFARAHFVGSPHVSAESLAVLHEAIEMEDGKGAYAMGWGVPQTKAVKGVVLAHDGSNGLNYASILLLPERKVALLAACNGGGERAQKAIVQTIMTLFGRYVLDQEAAVSMR